MRTSLLSALLLAAAAIGAHAQCPTPGSDGALTIAPNLGRVIFDAMARNIGDANNVFCFSSVDIGHGSTLVIHANGVRNPNSPVFFYVQGSFTMEQNSIIDLSGESSALEFTFPSLTAGGLTQLRQLRRPSIPGPGGFPGGLGLNGGTAAERGGGPGGGPAGVIAQDVTCNGGSASHFTAGFGSGATPISTVIYANTNLLPMYGGSGGGGGGGISSSDLGAIGGAGGGAIRIVAQSFSFSANTSILALGGGATPPSPAFSCGGGSASAGSIHIVAPAPIPTLNFIVLDVRSSSGGNGFGGNLGGSGLIRISTGDTSCICEGSVVFGPPIVPPLQTGTPSLQIVSIGGQSVPAEPTGSYITPDVVLNTSSAVTIQIAAVNIPVGTVVTLRITNEVQTDQAIGCAPLAGTLASSTATCSATYAQLGSMSSIRAVW